MKWHVETNEWKPGAAIDSDLRDKAFNDRGVTILEIGQYSKYNCTVFEYQDSVFTFRFQVWQKGARDLPDYESQKHPEIFNLGPNCEVSVSALGIPKPLSNQAAVSIAETIKDFLMNAQPGFSKARAPYACNVEFLPAAKFLLNL